jgi:hypothetical protein
VPVVAFLGLLWAAVLIPVAHKAVATRRAYFTSSFGDGLQALEQAEGFFGPIDAPAAEHATRRPAPALSASVVVDAALLRSILAGLLVAVGVSLLVAIVTTQRGAVAVNLALDNCLLAFVALVVRRRDQRNHVRRKVPGPEPELLEIQFEMEPPAPRRVYTAGVPVIAAPVAAALNASVASAG